MDDSSKNDSGLPAKLAAAESARLRKLWEEGLTSGDKPVTGRWFDSIRERGRNPLANNWDWLATLEPLDDDAIALALEKPEPADNPLRSRK